MKRERALAVLYDLTLTIGAEVTLARLLPRVLQRFLFHLSYPVGLVLRRADPGALSWVLEHAVGDHALALRKGQNILTPPQGWGRQALKIQDSELLTPLCQHRAYRHALWLPIDGVHGFLFLAEHDQPSELPLTEVFAPVLRNLARAIELCQRSEKLTQGLEHDRDDARARLAMALEASERERTFLSNLKNAIPDLIWLKDPAGVYLACNARFEQLFGASEAEIVGKTDTAFVSPELAEFFRSHDLKAMTADQPTQNEEWLTFAANGYQGLFQTTKLPMRDEKGQLVGVLGIAHDITELKAAQERLQLSASVFSSAREGILITGPDGQIVEVNDMFTQITGYERGEVMGRNPRMLSSGMHPASYYQRMWNTIAQRGHWSGEIWNRRKSGEVYPQQLTISAVKTPAGEVTHYVALFSDISELKTQQRELERVAHYDPVTGLANRVLLADRLAQGMSGVRRRGQALAIAFLDLDEFKSVNDRHGHHVGDLLLAKLADRMSSVLRDGDTLARWGGDEFVAVFIDLPHHAHGQALVQRLMEQIGQPVTLEGVALNVTASIGVTFYPQHDEVDADQLLRQADQAMYQAKLAGRERVHLFDSQADKEARGTNETLANVRQGLLHDQFELYYQPKVNLRSGELIGVEALIRWRHPERGLLPPAIFIPVVENHPIAVELGDWVLRRAMQDLKALHAMGIHTRVSVNVSALQFQQPDFVGHLLDLMSKHPHVKPDDLELELLESSALRDMAQVSDVLRACQRMGISSAIDDFGTGYSSLTYLKRLPAETLKIDQSFVRGMLADPEDVAILEGVIGLAAAFNRTLIAEGVETVDHGLMLLQLGCELGQGYGIGRPMPLQQLQAWRDEWKPDTRWKHVRPLRADERPLLYAGIEHRAWVLAFEDYLRGTRKVPPPLEVHQCQFGQWLTAKRRLNTREAQHLHELERVHDRIHAVATELVSLLTDNRQQEALTRLPEIHDLRDQLLALISDLLN